MSANYRAVEKELAAGTPAELICTTCPWDRLCITPPTMTRQEIEQQLAEAKAEDAQRPGRQGALPMATLMTAMTLGDKATSSQVCPVFALRLRGPDGRQVADGIRSMMRDGVGGGAS